MAFDLVLRPGDTPLTHPVKPEDVHPDEALADAHQVLDSEGRPLDASYDPPLADEQLVDLYRDMRLARRFDELMISRQRQGRLGTYASLAGQEGSQFGTMYALNPADWVVFQYREHGAVIDRGDLANYVRYWMGDEAGNASLVEHNIAPLNIAIASHIPHATGLAWAAALRGDDIVVVCHFGDGATSEGDFHEGLNIAGVFDVPVVFICHNNGWAISHPSEHQTASTSFAVKARAYGLPGVRVDGMDPLATYEVTRDAVERARRTDDDRPRASLIETVEYRFGAHTTADDPEVYRDDAEVDRWRERDPIPRVERFLRDRGCLDDDRVATIGDEVTATATEALDTAEAAEVDPDDLFEYVFASPTPRVAAQRTTMRALRERHGDAELLDRE